MTNEERNRSVPWQDSEFIMFNNYKLIYEIIQGVIMPCLPGGIRMTYSELCKRGNASLPKTIRLSANRSKK